MCTARNRNGRSARRERRRDESPGDATLECLAFRSADPGVERGSRATVPRARRLTRPETILPRRRRLRRRARRAHRPVRDARRRWLPPRRPSREVHDADDQEDHHQTGTAVAAVAAESQAVSPGRAGVGRQCIACARLRCWSRFGASRRSSRRHSHERRRTLPGSRQGDGPSTR